MKEFDIEYFECLLEASHSGAILKEDEKNYVRKNLDEYLERNERYFESLIDDIHWGVVLKEEEKEYVRKNLDAYLEKNEE